MNFIQNSVAFSVEIAIVGFFVEIAIVAKHI